jgi:hypothetical protein
MHDVAMLAELISRDQPFRRADRYRSGRCALERTLDEDVRATRADLLLGLVGNTRALHDHVHPLRHVLMGETLGHRQLERY